MRLMNVATAAAVLFGAAGIATAQTEDYDRKLEELRSKYEKQVQIFEQIVKGMRRQMDEDFRTLGDMWRKVRQGEKPAAGNIPTDDAIGTFAADLRDDVEHGRVDVKNWAKRAETRISDRRKAWEAYFEYLRLSPEEREKIASPPFPTQGGLVTVFRDLSDDLEHLNADLRRVGDRTAARVGQERAEWRTFRNQVRKEAERIFEKIRKDVEEIFAPKKDADEDKK